MPNSQELDILMKFIEAQVRSVRVEITAVKEAQEAAYVEIMDKFDSAFPENDLPGHKKYHQQIMEEAKTRQEIRKEIMKKLLAGGAWSTIVFFGYRVIDYVKGYFNVFGK